MEASKGKWDKDIFTLPIRVYYEDTDMSGIVYHANFLRYAERARSELVRSLGYDATGLRQNEGIYFVVRHCEIDFLCPAKIDDELFIECRVLKFPATNILVSQDVWCGDKKLAAMVLHLVCLNLEGKVTRIPQGLRAAYDQITAADLTVLSR